MRFRGATTPRRVCAMRKGHLRAKRWPLFQGAKARRLTPRRAGPRSLNQGPEVRRLTPRRAGPRSLNQGPEVRIFRSPGPIAPESMRQGVCPRQLCAMYNSYTYVMHASKPLIFYQIMIFSEVLTPGFEPTTLIIRSPSGFPTCDMNANPRRIKPGARPKHNCHKRFSKAKIARVFRSIVYNTLL